MTDPAPKSRRQTSRKNSGHSGMPLEDATITQVDLLNHSTIIVELSNGDTITIDAAELKELALTGRLGYMKASG